MRNAGDGRECGLPIAQGFVIGAILLLLMPPAYSEPRVMNLSGAVLNSQISQMSAQQISQQFQFSLPKARPSSINDDVIFLDRFKNPISEEEFMWENRRHHLNRYNATHNPNPETLAPVGNHEIAPPPPEDASFQ